MKQDGRGFRVCVFGASLDVGNMGCRALGASLVRLFVRARPDSTFSFLYGSRSGGKRTVRLSDGQSAEVEVFNFRLSPKARLQEHLIWILFLAAIHRLVPSQRLRRRIRAANPWLRALSEADLIGDIRGGDSFSDIYGLRRFLVGAMPYLIAVLMGKKPVLLPQTYGPYRSAIARGVARFTMRRAKRIYARDGRSLDAARGILGARAAQDAPRLCPDAAFALEPIEPAQPRIEPPADAHAVRPTVCGLNVNGLLCMGGYSRDNMFGLRSDYGAFARALLERLTRIPGVEALLIPHTFGSSPQNDQAACEELWRSLAPETKRRVRRVVGEYDQSELKFLIGRCDFMIGSRMHACVAALSQGVPSVGVAYSRKFKGVFETVGMGDMALDARELSAEELVEGCVARFEDRARIAESLRRSLPDARERLEACFSEIVRDAR